MELKLSGCNKEVAVLHSDHYTVIFIAPGRLLLELMGQSPYIIFGARSGSGVARGVYVCTQSMHLCTHPMHM